MGTHENAPAYRLSPMQQGMLFESPTLCGSGAYTMQALCRLHQEVDIAAFIRSWQEILQRHDVLRTEFIWGNLHEPLQQVVTRVDLPFEMEDWSTSSPVDIERRLEERLMADRQRGFEFSSAPLTRITLLRFGEKEWAFLWSFHHTIMDGRSRNLVLKEWCQLYRACCHSEDLQLPQPRPYRDYINWLSLQSFATAKTYWDELLSGMAPLPVYSPPLENSFRPDHDERYRSHKMEIHPNLDNRLKSAGSVRGVALSAMVQLGWAIILAHHTCTKDVIFGVTRSGRSTGPEGIESMVGLFINTLPMCLRMNSAKLISDCLKEVRQQNIAMMRFYEHLSLAEIQKFGCTPAGSQLFDTVVVLEENDLASSLGASCREMEFIRHGFSSVGLSLLGYLNPELSLEMSFDSSRFSKAFIETLASHYLHALEGIAAAGPQTCVGDLQLLSEEERRQVRTEWKIAQQRPTSKCLHELFGEQAARTPARVALECGAQKVTYGELNQRSNQVAHYLQHLGVRPEARVGLCMEVSSDLIICLIGILKAGAAYVPLDPSYPAERLKYMAEDAEVMVLLTDGCSAGERLAGWHRNLVNVKTEQTDLAQVSNEKLMGATPHNLAYVIYTSGSTGKPKGVAVTHANVTRLFAATQPWFDFTCNDVWTMFHSYAFDFSVWEMWGALLYGGKVVLVSPTQSRSPEVFYEMLEWHGVTVLNQTPSAFRHLLEVDAKEQSELRVRAVIFGGEALDPQMLAGWRQRHPQTQLVNMYGITEITVHGTYVQLADADLQASHSVIGTGIPDLEMYVLDTEMNLAPIGVPGELYVGGAGLARGYLNRPELTAERFLPDPYGPQAGARLYKTGDRVRWQVEHRLEFLGRVDHQVKIRGYRIELGEIEAVMTQHPAVKHAIISLRDFDGDKRIVAHFLAHETTTVEEKEVSKYLKEHLPDYMVPSWVMKLKSLPLTPNGKIDRAALPSPEYAKETYAPPRTMMEGLLARMWAELLHVNLVGLRDNFFTLGGHSLLAMQVASRLREILQIDLPTRFLFGHPTIETLSRALIALEPVTGQFEKIAQIFLMVAKDRGQGISQDLKSS